VSTPDILPAEARTRQRDQAASELVRALLILNAGGAAALLVFLTALWPMTGTAALIKPTIVALGCLALGAALAALFPAFRYKASLLYQANDAVGGLRWRRLYFASAYASLICFLIGVLVLACYAWKASDSRRDVRPPERPEQGRPK
jgi:hypothetical protein